MPEQVSEANAHEMADALARELDFAATEQARPASLEPPADKKPK
jgi:hypothetical protein